MGLGLSACGQKQATDPRQVLGEHMQHGGVDGRSGQPTAARRAADERGAEPADEGECRDAAEHLVRLGIELAIQQEQDPEQKQRLAAEREEAEESEQAQALMRKWTQECLDRGDTRAEVECILEATREADLEACAPAE